LRPDFAVAPRFFGRLAGYEDLNAADRLAYDPAIRGVVER